MSELSERLREAHPNSQQYALGSNILLEAAQEIESLQAHLYEARAECVDPLEQSQQVQGEVVAYYDPRPGVDWAYRFLEPDEIEQEDNRNFFTVPLIANQPAPAAVPVAWEFQHEETGLIDFIDPQQVEWGFEKNNPRWQKIGPVYRHPPQTQQEEESAVQQHYPCGCVTCICEDDVQCQGCGGTSCDDFKGPSCGCTHLKEEAER